MEVAVNEKENEHTSCIRAWKTTRVGLLMVLQSKTRTATTIAAEITPQIMFAGAEKISSLSTIPLPFKHSLMELHLDNYSNRSIFINQEC